MSLKPTVNRGTGSSTPLPHFLHIIGNLREEQVSLSPDTTGKAPFTSEFSACRLSVGKDLSLFARQ